MKLLDALELLTRPVSEPASTREIFLECGFTPLHLKTFLDAHLRLCFPCDRVEIKTGLFGDLAGNLERLRPSDGSVVCIVIEWLDLDPRLGIRSLGGWRATDISDIVESARHQGERLVHLVKQLAEHVPTYVSLPTLPLPPIFTTRGSQVNHEECKLREVAASLASSLSGCKRARLVNGQRLDEVSPFARRFDAKAEISSGFPYSLEHASRIAELITTLIHDAPPKKGLITDLDDTLWAGILGEIGPEGVSWDMSGGAHAHGLYQRFLESLATAGVLLAVASKNDSTLVEKAFAREDILLPRESLFPLEINWGPKSASVHQILKQWNIAPDDVVFIDDSPMEVAEVHAAFPQMECIVFPKSDCQAVWDILKWLRDCFGKSLISTEDKIRSRSIRSAAALRGSLQVPDFDADNFLRDAKATISFSLKPDIQDSRAYELINKTNQFNLNGRRFTESQWLSFFQDSSAFLLTATYEDKYGPLGKIAVVMGKARCSAVHIDAWVMSCRAFSRRIEHQCLKYLFDRLNAAEISLGYKATQRNAPIQDFLAELAGQQSAVAAVIRRTCFEERAPALFHHVVEAERMSEQEGLYPRSTSLGR